MTHTGPVVGQKSSTTEHINIGLLFVLLCYCRLITQFISCDKTVPVKLKDKESETVIKPTVTYGAEGWVVRKEDENKYHIAEMRLLGWIRGTTRKDHDTNQVIHEDAKVCQMSTLLSQKILNWYGHIS